MARSTIAMQNFNVLYTAMKSVASTRGITYTVKVFNDGGAVINIIVTGQNITVSLSALVTPIYEDNKIVAYRVSDEDRVEVYSTLRECVGFARYLINSTRVILQKI